MATKKKRVKPEVVFSEINRERKRKGFFSLTFGKLIWTILLCLIPGLLWAANILLVNQVGVQIIFGILMIPIDIVWLIFSYLLACVLAWLCRKSFLICLFMIFLYVLLNAAMIGIAALAYFILNLLL